MTLRRLMALGAALLTVALTLAACEERRDASPRDATAVASSTAVTKREATAGPKTTPAGPFASAPPKTTVRPTTPEERAGRFPTATPMPVTKPRLVGGIPESAVVPLLVYSRALRQVVIGGNDIPVLEIVTYDIGRGQVVAAFDFSADPEAGAYADLQLSGRQLLVQGGRRSTPPLRWYALDGTLVREAQLHPANFPGRVVPSPDGRLYAQDVDGGVVIVDVASDHVVNHFEGPTQPAGEPLAPIAWAEDSAWVVAQAINPHRASGLWMLMADGTKRELAAGGEAAKWRVTADGRYAVLLTGIACPNGAARWGRSASTPARRSRCATSARTGPSCASTSVGRDASCSAPVTVSGRCTRCTVRAPATTSRPARPSATSPPSGTRSICAAACPRESTTTRPLRLDASRRGELLGAVLTRCGLSASGRRSSFPAASRSPSMGPWSHPAERLISSV